MGIPNCEYCGVVMKPLAGLSFFCPNECDLKKEQESSQLQPAYPVVDPVSTLCVTGAALDLDGKTIKLNQSNSNHWLDSITISDSRFFHIMHQTLLSMRVGEYKRWATDRVEYFTSKSNIPEIHYVDRYRSWKRGTVHFLVSGFVLNTTTTKIKFNCLLEESSSSGLSFDSYIVNRVA